MWQLNWIMSATLALLSVAAAASTNVSIGGQSVTLSSVVGGGKTYVSLDQLKTALTAAGGSTQLSSAEGCMNQWLFDGVWRLRVTKLEFKPNPKDSSFWGWIVTTEIHNGTKDTLSFYDSGIEHGVSLALKDGSLLEMSNSSRLVDILFQDIPQGSGIVVPLNFRGPDGATDAQVQANPPQKLLLPIDLKAQTYHNLKLPYASHPNFRVNLTCSKPGQ